MKAKVLPGRTHKWATRGAALLVVLVLTNPAWAVKIATYNLLQYSSGRTTQFKTVLNAMQPDVLVVQEIANQSAVNYFLNNVLNAGDGPGGYLAATFTGSGSLNNALFYRTASITYGGTSDHTTLPTSPRLTDRWRLGLAGGSVEFYVYSMHLAASDPDARLAQCTTVRNNANQFPSGTHFVYVGDFNLDSSGEGSYQQLIGSQTDNDGRAFDPINTPGAWHNDCAFAHVHTQCTHLNNPNAPPGSVGGGMDDRFDFILASAALLDGQGFDYVSGTYKAFGNDGLHCNQDINDPPVIPEGQAVADALHGASDHLPVVMELTAPPILVVDESLDFGTLIVGAAPPANQQILTVQNGATPPALDLQYTFSYVPPGYTPSGGSFTLPAGQSRQHTFSLSTATAGYYNGDLIITNTSPINPKAVYLFGTVQNHAIPSTSGSSQVLTALLDFGAHPIGGFTNQTANAHNLGWTPLQALLQVYAYNITGQDAVRFSLVSFSPTYVATLPAGFGVHFDDAGAAYGPYAAALQFSTRDDPTAPGWTNLSPLTFDLSATVGLKGDMNTNGTVELLDVPGFVSVLLNPAGASSSQRWTADMNADSANDGKDIQLFIAALVAGP